MSNKVFVFDFAPRCTVYCTINVEMDKLYVRRLTESIHRQRRLAVVRILKIKCWQLFLDMDESLNTPSASGLSTLETLR